MRRLFALVTTLAALLVAAPVYAQGTTMPEPLLTFFTNSGAPCASCKLYTYDAGTTTPRATYTDVALTIANTNPVVMDSSGRPSSGAVFLSPTTYKFVLKTSADVTLWTADNIGATPTTNVSLDVTGTAGEALSAGEAVYLADGAGGTTAGRWYKADADAAASSSTAKYVGQVQSAISSGASGSIRIQGRVTGLSALTAGTQYYVSATAGGLTSSAPANARLVGVADSTTSLLIAPNPGSSFTTLAVSGTSAFTGVATFTAAPAVSAGISFPATQAAQAGANNLDDYEEGAWTPTISGAGGTSGQSYTTQSGQYIKIGKLVYASLYVHIATEGTITGNAYIGGLPFPVAVNSNGASVHLQWRDLATTWVEILCLPGVEHASGCGIQGAAIAAVSAITSLTATDVADGTRFSGTIVYQATN